MATALNQQNELWVYNSLTGKKERFVQAMKFVFFSASAGVIQLGSFTLMNEILKWNYWVCYLIALTLSPSRRSMRLTASRSAS